MATKDSSSATLVAPVALDVEEKAAVLSEQPHTPPAKGDVWKAPNGGFEAWLQVAAGFFLSMNSW